MKKVLGWILMILCGYLCLTHIACIPVFLVISDIDWLSRIVGVLYGLIFALVFGWLTRLGNRLRTGKKGTPKRNYQPSRFRNRPNPLKKSSTRRSGSPIPGVSPSRMLLPVRIWMMSRS